MRHRRAGIDPAMARWNLVLLFLGAFLAPLSGFAGAQTPGDAAIESMVWFDTNRDGIRDRSEPGVADIQVSLLDCDGNFADATRTDAQGRYRFDVAAGCYRVRFAATDGYRYCPANLGGDTRRDSDADPATGLTATMEIGRGVTLRAVDAGIVDVRGGELGDRVWEDRNANGIQDVGEPGIAGALVQLLDCNGTPLLDERGVPRQSSTDASGYFAFEDLSLGCYGLRVATDDAWRFSPPDRADDAHDSDIVPRLGQTQRFYLSGEHTRFDVDFGLYRPGRIGDYVWFDRNGNGVQDAGEPGVADIGVLLLDRDGVPLGRRVRTNARGYFEFDDVTPGDYRLQYIIPPDYRISRLEQGVDVRRDSDANSLGTTRIVSLSSGSERLDLDLGLFGGEPVAVALEKLTNGQDADDPTGPFVEAGGDVLWEYIVTNTGQADLFQVVVTDDQGVSVNCDANFIPGGSFIVCTGQTDDAQPGQYMNNAMVCANDGTDEPVEVCASDASHYFGSLPGVTMEKRTNGEDADQPNGPNIVVGDPVVWEYDVVNTGNVELTDIVVTDSEGVSVVCPSTSLLPGVSMTCSGEGTATAGAYMNVGTVSAMPPVGDPVEASDPSHYFGISPQVSLQKTTNGEDADDAPGPSIGVGEPITWRYVVRNDGNVTLSNITVTDDQGVDVSCPPLNVAPGTSLTCIGTGVAEVGPYMNIGTVCASAGDDADVCATDPSHYTGVSPMVELQKLTQNVDADEPTGPNVIVGLPITWDYVVTNTGATPLTDIVVTDSDASLVVVCPDTQLDPGASFTCSATGSSEPGQYSNLGTVTASGNGVSVSDTDPSHYFGVFFDIELEKATNGIDADTAPGPVIAAGEPVTWTYVATNTGNVRLDKVFIVDDQGVQVTCPPGASLAPGESITCTGQGVAQVGQYANVGDVCGFFEEEEVCDTDPSHYFGSDAGVAIEKSTNGEDADLPPGPQLTEGDPVTWTYTVTNTGNLTVTDIVVTDDQGVSVSCPSDTLAPAQSFVCTASGTAVVGQYMNVGSVSGQPVDGGGSPAGPPVGSSDPSHYIGVPIQLASIGDTVFVDEDRDGVQDPGEPGLPGVTVNLWVDDDGDGTPDRIIATATTDANGNYVFEDLDPGLVYFVQFLAPPGQPFTTPDVGDDAADSDADPATGITPPITLTPGESNTTIDAGVITLAAGVDIEKATNGEDADVAPGPALTVGDPVTWTYVITNTGELTLTGISVSDDQGVAVSCPTDTLPPGDSMTCTGSGTVEQGQYANLGTVSAQPSDNGTPVGDPVVDSDPSHYVGEEGDCIVSSSPRHSIWLREFYGPGPGTNARFNFGPEARLARNDDGTATITGTVRGEFVDSQAFSVVIDLAGGTSVPPPGSPRNLYGADTSDWFYYPQWSATLTGIEDYAGAVMTFSRVGPAFQIGTGANDTPEDISIFGGSGWQDYLTVQQPDSCISTGDNCIADGGHGEVMVRIECPEDTGRTCGVDEAREFALDLPGLTGDLLAGRYDLAGDAQITFMGNGSAYLHAMAHKRGESAYRYAVDLWFEGRTAVAPPGSPDNPQGLDASDWEYYTRWGGMLTGEGENAGAQVILGYVGPAFQVGLGASAVDGEHDIDGGSGRVGWSVGAQPQECESAGRCLVPKGEGHIRLHMSCAP